MSEPEAVGDTHRLVKERYLPCQHPLAGSCGVYFSCRKCGPCLARVRHDAVGRGIAESYGCDAAFYVTYTIGGDRFYGSTGKNPKAQALHKPDMQAAIKRLLFHTAVDAKKANLPRPSLRHFYVGEFGDMKGRPHYHHLVYMRGYDRLLDFPEELYGQNVFFGQMDGSIDVKALPHVKSDRTFWPHGFIHVKPFEYRDAGYLASYVNKPPALDGGGEGELKLMAPGRSLRPFLGADWFDMYAKYHVDQELSLHDDGYRLPKEPGFTGRDAVYWMSPTVKRFVGAAYVGHWRRRFGDDSWPSSPLLDWLAESDARRVDKVRFEGVEFFHRLKGVRENRRLRSVRLQREGAMRRWPEGNAYEAFSTGAAQWVDGDYELVRGTGS